MVKVLASLEIVARNLAAISGVKVFSPFWAENDVPEGWEGFRKLLGGGMLHSDRT